MKSNGGKVMVMAMLLIALVIAAYAVFAAGDTSAPKGLAASPPPPNAADTLFLPFANIATVEIKAPVEKVFKYVEDPMNLLKWFPDIKTVTDVKGKGLGRSFRWTLEREDVGKGEGLDVTTAYTANQSFEVVDTSNNHWTVIFQSTPDKGTKLTLVLQTAAVVTADQSTWPEAIKKSQTYLEGYAKNIKTEMEKPPAPAPAPAPVPKKP